VYTPTSKEFCPCILNMLYHIVYSFFPNSFYQVNSLGWYGYVNLIDQACSFASLKEKQLSKFWTRTEKAKTEHK
jgi:hypothetical protein